VTSADLFKSFQAIYYDRLYESKNYSHEVAFIQNAIESFLATDSSKITLLDMGCGTGNHASKLASELIQVTGIDISFEMIELAIKKQDNANSNPHFTVANLLDFRVDQPFDVICIMFNVIGYLEEYDSLSKLLNKISNTLLKPGGLLIFDFWDIHGVQNDSAPIKELQWEINGHRVVRASRSSFDNEANKLQIEFEWTETDISSNNTHDEISEVHKEIHSILFYDRDKVETMLKNNNFEIFVNLFAPSFLDKRSCLLVARKQLH
jgi:2-polyprenyl-3-methyl-5-hydroxy-6-metoxy-1,4-benzoquinol methylase